MSDGITAEDGSAQFGRLEFYSAGGWGTVCNLQNLDFGADPEPLVPFTDASAVIACRQLGFSDGVPAGPTRERSRGSLGSVVCLTGTGYNIETVGDRHGVHRVGYTPCTQSSLRRDCTETSELVL